MSPYGSRKEIYADLVQREHSMLTFEGQAIRGADAIHEKLIVGF